MDSSEVAKVTFSTTKWREGYAMEGVDDMLDQIRAALQSWEAGRPGELKAETLLTCRFQPTKFRTGYDQDEVDKFLDRANAALNGYEFGPRP
jgi:DivIVA domain-containing protein